MRIKLKSELCTLLLMDDSKEAAGSSGTDAIRRERKRMRNKRRKSSNRIKKKEKIRQVYAKSKELEKELTDTKSKLFQTKMKALMIRKEMCKSPALKKYSVSTAASSLQYFVRTKPTASSGFHSSHRVCNNSTDMLQCQVKRLDRYSLISTDLDDCEVLGSGTFGKCTKMILSGTKVAVKATTLDAYSCANIMHEAVVLTEVCCGHPNLPLYTSSKNI